MRRFAILCVLTGLAFSGCMGMSPAHAAGCPGTAWLAVGGTGDPGSTGVPGIPRGAWTIRIIYPADILRGDYSRHIAASKLDREAWAMRTRCPATHIAVRAHSLGASAASLSTDGWIGTRLAYNTDAVLFGNPRRPGTRHEGGLETVGLPNLPGYRMRGAHRPAWWITDICHVGNDIICSAPRPWTANPASAVGGIAGYLSTGHHY